MSLKIKLIISYFSVGIASLLIVLLLGLPLWISLVSILILCVLVGFLSITQIVKPITELQQIVKQVAVGNFKIKAQTNQMMNWVI